MTTLEPYFLLGLIRRRYKIIAACVVAGLLGAGLHALRTPPTYVSDSRVFVNLESAQTVTEQAVGFQLTSQLLQSYAEIATSRSAAARIDQALGLTSTEAWSISATPEPDTLLITIRATASSPQIAQRIAGAATDNFVRTVAELERGKANEVRAEVIDPPSLTSAPVSPRKKLSLFLGLLVGLLVAAVAALLRDALDRTIKTAEQAEDVLQLPRLGSVPRLRDAERQPAAAFTGEGGHAGEAYRAIRTAIQFVNPDAPLRSLLVTSASPGEGKTITSMNLAVALAQAGIETIIVDVDLRRGRIAEAFGLEGAVGLSNLVLGAASVDDVVQEWRPGLGVVPTGPLPPNPAELLGSQAMVDVVAALTERADLVLFDAPPVLPVTDAVVLSAQVDGVIMVIHAGAAHRTHAAEALRRLRAVGSHPVGFVLNRVKRGASDSGYYGTYTAPIHDSPEQPQPSRSSR